MSEPHVWAFCTLNTCVGQGDLQRCTPLGLASRSRGGNHPRRPTSPAHFSWQHLWTHPTAWTLRIWRKHDHGSQGKLRRLPHVGLRRTEKTPIFPTWLILTHLGHASPGQKGSHGWSAGSVSDDASLGALSGMGIGIRCDHVTHDPVHGTTWRGCTSQG